MVGHGMSEFKSWRVAGVAAVIKGCLRSFRSEMGYTVINPHSLGKNVQIESAWKEPFVPELQLRVVKEQITAYRDGCRIPVFDALVDVLQHNLVQRGAQITLLEVGCSSGYYNEVLNSSGLQVVYRGCDYSTGFVKLAKKLYPSLGFDLEDACEMSYAADSFDVVISSGCLLHILDFKRAIVEASRVAREFVAFHRTPVTHFARTTYFSKSAYGTRMLEIHFNEQELVREFSAVGLQVVDAKAYEGHWRTLAEPDFLLHKTYLCRKVGGQQAGRLSRER